MLWPGLSLITVLILLWVAIRVYRNSRSAAPILSPRKTLMDTLLRDFKAQLEKAVGEDFDVFPHIRLADLLITERSETKQAKTTLLKIQTTTVDFVLTEKGSGKIACVLILIHHGTLGSRQQFIRHVCQQSKLPFLIFDIHNPLNEKQIRQKIMALLEPTILLDENTSHDIKVYLDPGQGKDKQHQTGFDA